MQDYSKPKALSSGWLVIAGCTLVGALVRLGISSQSIGSNDVVNWYFSAERILNQGLIRAYESDPYLNNPPLISLIMAELLKLSRMFEVPFPILLRSVGIAGEALSIALVAHVGYLTGGIRQSVLLGAIVALNPLSVLVTGYHGHTDGLVGGFVCLGFYLSTIFQQYALAGFALGLAMNVKLIPLVLWPALFFSIPSVRGRIISSVGLAVALIPFVVTWWFGGSVFFSRVFGYRSILDYWGFQTFLIIFRSQNPQWAGFFDAVIGFYQQIGPFLILGVVTIINLVVQLSPWQRGAVSFATMAVLAQGFGITYPALAMPLFTIVNARWALKYSVVNALALLATYTHFLVRRWPWQSVHIGSSPKLSVLCMFFMWVMLLMFVVTQLRSCKVWQPSVDRGET